MEQHWWRELLDRYRGRLIGTAAGFVLGLLIMWVGVFWALVIGLLSLAGYQLGRRFDEAGDGMEGLSEFLDRILQGRR